MDTKESGKPQPSPGPWWWDAQRMALKAQGKEQEFDVLYMTNGCDPPNEADATIIANAPTMLTLLRELEWRFRPDDDGGGEECPMCERKHYEGHAPDCRLSKLLEELK